MRRVVLYEGFERFWHWTQALLILTMMLTGFEIRGVGPHLFGFARAVTVHNFLAVALVTLIVFAIFWHVTTGEWRQYVPTRKFLREMVGFYLTGIFKGAPHPVKKHRMAKLNPLQRLAYLGFKVLIIPVQVTTGALYFLYPNLSHSLGWSPTSLWFIAVAHVLGAFGLLAFLVGHVYLTTTGHTLGSNIKAMITGWEDLPDDGSLDDEPQP
jgi:thiosulfate reductase cytochrome b subunit